MSFELIGVEVENLRGYSHTSLQLNKRITFIVGPNNAGKTSIIKLLDWFINLCDEEIIFGRPLNKKECDFLMPARDARHKARRLTLLVKVSDGRSQGRYECENGIARLRLNVRKSPSDSAYIAVGWPKRGELAQSQQTAIELLQAVRDKHFFIHVPSFREGTSESFKRTQLHAFKRRLKSKFIHRGQGGWSRNERDFKAAFEAITKLIKTQAQPLWTDLKSLLPPGMIKSALVDLPVTKEQMIEDFCEQLSIRISTGVHDNKRVSISEVGAGLQSLLALVINLSEAKTKSKQIIIAIEEPEAFLHPAAQRTIARQLRSVDIVDKAIVTTHSPIIVEEAAFGEVVLCHDQKFYEPQKIDEAREQINTALLSGFGAEMIFSCSVLLVEGDGDRQFFERLRRRLSVVDNEGRLDKLFVVPAGGNSQFAPWIRLLNSYGRKDDRPIKWYLAPDGDSVSELRRALRDAKITLPQETSIALQKISIAIEEGIESWRGAIKSFNKLAQRQNVKVAFLDIDLEYTMLGNVSDEFLEKVADKANTNFESREQLLGRLGSKSQGQPPNRPLKDPWLRGFIGEHIPFSQLTDSAKNVLRKWMRGVMLNREVTDIFNRAEELN